MRILNRLMRLVTGSVSRKLILSVLLVHTLLVTVVTWEVVVREREALEQQRLARASGVAHMLAVSGTPWMLSEDTAGLTELIRSASSMPGLRYAMFIEPNGRILAHTDGRRTGQFVAQLLEDSKMLRPRTEAALKRGGRSIEAVAPVVENGNPVGWAWVSVTLADLDARERELIAEASLFSGLAILLGVVFAFLTARGLTRGLAGMAEACERFRLGERGVRAVTRGHDEVATAASGLNAMFEAVIESEQSLRDVQRIARLGSWTHDIDQGTLSWTEPVYELFGLDASCTPTFEGLMGSIAEEDRAKIVELEEKLAPGRAISLNIDVLRPGGERRTCWMEARLRVNTKTGGKIFFGICQDITEREAAAAQLRQAQKMEVVGQLTGGLAHDFNNLLAVVIGNLDLVQEGSGTGDRELVAEALQAALRGSDLTKHLLAFSRRQRLAPCLSDLNDIAAGTAKLIRRAAAPSIEVRLVPGADLWRAEVDAAQLEAAILNLGLNARDAMPNGGVLSIETRNVRLDLDTRESWAEEDLPAGEYALISVSDNGCGMEPEAVSKAFEPFFTTKSVGQGSGLGLSMVYGFAKQSGGSAKIYSEPGHGTTVRLYLPRSERDESAPAAETIVSAPRGSATETILVVEDDANVRSLAVRQLRDLGYTVLTAEDGNEALNLLTPNSGIDLLFTDVVMPGGINGFELAEKAVQRCPSLKVLHTSGFTRLAMSTGRDTGAKAGYALLPKPYRKAELATHVRDVLGNAAGVAA